MNNQKEFITTQIVIRKDGEREYIDARELHAAMGIGRRYTDWLKDRIAVYGFIEGFDYTLLDFPNLGNQESVHGGDRKSKLYAISLDMAKELAMIEHNETGRAIRRYFIEAEKKLRENESAATVIGAIYGHFSNCPAMSLQKINRFVYYLAMEPQISQADIAKLLDVSDATICFWKKSVSRDHAKLAVKICGITAQGAVTYSTPIITKRLKKEGGAA